MRALCTLLPARAPTAKHPNAKDQKGCMDAMRHFGRIRKYAGPNDAAHHDHCGIKQSELTTRLYGCCHSEWSEVEESQNVILSFLDPAPTETNRAVSLRST